MAASLFGKEKFTNPAMDIPLRKAHGVEYVRVTPEIAQHWLSFNAANRETTQAKIDQYKSDMVSGYWNDDGSTICFAYGKLIDGQHRLMALVLAGVTIRMLVVFGLDGEVQVTKDTGRGRTPRDVLSIEGLDAWCSSTLGTAIHYIIAYETGRTLYSTLKFTNREVRNYYLEHQPRLDASVQVCKGYPRRHPLLPLSRVLALHYIFAKKDAAAATQFFDRLLTGAELTKSSPIYFLRKLLDTDLHEKKHRTAYEQTCFVVKAWNTFRRGGTVKSGTYMYPRDNEAFPEIA
jgi:hypothetical protein